MTLTLYVYDTESQRLVARVRGADNAQCEALAAAEYGAAYGWTYSPAFGANGGPVDDADAVDHEANPSAEAAS